MKLINVLTFVAFALCLNRVAFARATESGGACQNVDGTLGDVAENQGSVLLSDSEIKAAMQLYTKDLDVGLPYFSAGIENLNHMYWYLEPKALNADTCGLDDSAITIGTSPVACQVLPAKGAPDVRISMQVWKTASPELKAQIILHESLRTVQLARGYSAVGLRRIVRAILTKTGSRESYFENVRATIFYAGFGYFLTQSEIAQLKVAVDADLQSVCSLALADYKVKAHALYVTALTDTKNSSPDLAVSELAQAHTGILSEMNTWELGACTDKDKFFTAAVGLWQFGLTK